MDLAWRVAGSLGDGRFHSGQRLARTYGVSRGSIWNAIRALRERGLVVHAVRGKGYCLPDPVDWFESDAVFEAIPADSRDSIESLVTQRETESTNAVLLRDRPPAAGQAAVCVADYQTRGRGRRGRDWLSPPGAGICLSVAWQFLRPPARLQALGIAAGLTVRRVLKREGIPGISLKWPNDLMWGARKLGGILVELRAEGNGPVFLVVGVGMNYRISPDCAEAIVGAGGLPAVDLATACPREVPGRNRLAGVIIGALVCLLADYRERGAALLDKDWVAADAIADRAVTVTFGDRNISGIARGVDDDGALMVDCGGELLRVTAGDVSVRTEA